MPEQYAAARLLGFSGDQLSKPRRTKIESHNGDDAISEWRTWNKRENSGGRRHYFYAWGSSVLNQNVSPEVSLQETSLNNKEHVHDLWFPTC